MRNNDTRCCGTGTCMINAEGICWCGQRWDGEKMCAPDQPVKPAVEVAPDAGLDDSSAEVRMADLPSGA